VQCHQDEAEAFEKFAHSNPNNAIFLLDTYDTLAAARKVVALAPKLKESGIRAKAVRLDSGNLAELSKAVRKILDEGGLKETRILASGNLEEEELERLTTAEAPIDGYGIGTRLITSSDTPYLECAYKLVEYDGKPSRKYSEGKATWPGRKQVFRQFVDGQLKQDVLGLTDDTRLGTKLLSTVMRDGKRLFPAPSLAEIRQRALCELNQLPEALRSLHAPHPYRVSISQGLEDLATEMQARQLPRVVIG
jgi:nicotinate phosphoribosyltransferase